MFKHEALALAKQQRPSAGMIARIVGPERQLVSRNNVVGRGSNWLGAVLDAGLKAPETERCRCGRFHAVRCQEEDR